MMLQKYPRCQVYINVKGRPHQCRLTAEDMDHCIIRRNKKFEKYINSLEWNFQPSCIVCNRLTHATDTAINRELWFEHQLKAYGVERIREDLERAPEKMKLHNTDYGDAIKWLSRHLGEETK